MRLLLLKFRGAENHFNVWSLPHRLHWDLLSALLRILALSQVLPVSIWISQRSLNWNSCAIVLTLYLSKSPEEANWAPYCSFHRHGSSLCPSGQPSKLCVVLLCPIPARWKPTHPLVFTYVVDKFDSMCNKMLGQFKICQYLQQRDKMPMQGCLLPECECTIIKGASVCIWSSYQAVLQCLYTQCQTSQFGAAVHHALLECSTYEINDSSNLPPLIRHQGLRKRSNRTLGNVSSHVSASVIRSIVRGSPAFSAFSTPYPSQSVAPTTISDQEEQNTLAKPRLFPTSSAVLNATVILNTLSSGIWSPLPTPQSLRPDWNESPPAMATSKFSVRYSGMLLGCCKFRIDDIMTRPSLWCSKDKYSGLRHQLSLMELSPTGSDYFNVAFAFPVRGTYVHLGLSRPVFSFYIHEAMLVLRGLQHRCKAWSILTRNKSFRT